MVVAGGFKASNHRLTEVEQCGDEAIVFRPAVENDEAPPSLLSRKFDQDIVAVLGNIDGYQNGIAGVDSSLVMVGLP